MRVEPFSAGVKYTLDDGSEQITLLLWQSVYDQLVDPHALAVGATVHVQGEMAEYRGELEIVPELPTDVNVLAAAPVTTPAATPIPDAQPRETLISDLSLDRLGETVQIHGTVQDAASFSQGFKFTLDDGSGQIILLTWLDVYDGIAGREALRPGATLAVTGALDQFQDELQIVPTGGTGVRLLSPGDEQAPHRSIASLTLNDVGQWVLIEGTVTRADAFGSGVRVYLDDGSGEVLVLLWQNVVERVPAEVGVTTVGQRLRVAGRVEKYEGALEIVPALPFDVYPGP